MEWLNQNQGAVVAILTAVLCVFNGVVVWFSYLRVKATNDPAIVAFIRPHPVQIGMAELVVANIGQAAALDLEFSNSLPQEKRYGASFRVPGSVDGVRRVDALLPGDQLCFRILAVNNLVDDPDAKNFGLVVEYGSLGRRSRVRRPFNLSIENWKGYVWGGTDPAVEVSRRLAELNSTLKGLRFG